MIETIVKDYLCRVFDCALDKRIDGFAKFIDWHLLVALANAFEEIFQNRNRLRWSEAVWRPEASYALVARFVRMTKCARRRGT